MNSVFNKTKQLFDIPSDTVYLDGNSLGPPTKMTSEKVCALIERKWAKLLVKGWNEDNWIDKPKHVGNKIAKLIGAKDNTVVVGDTLSVKTYQALYAAIKLQKKRNVILSDTGNFQSDLYIAMGLIESFNQKYELKVVKPEDVAEAMTDEIGVLFLTEVDYRTGRKHDMSRLTEKARKLGIITIWDLAHSVGILPINLELLQVDFAVGCTYKYLNGGPGSPAFIYIAPKHHNTAQNPIKGWLGHSSPFSFLNTYHPAPGVEKMQIGTPPVIAITALEPSLDIFSEIDIKAVRQKSIELTDLFIIETRKKNPMLELISPDKAEERGAHVSYRFKNGYAVVRCLINHGVICDFRVPDIMRFGFNPLYINESDVRKASNILTKILKYKKWDKPHLKQKLFVT